jgi:hypothetical protein
MNGNAELLNFIYQNSQMGVETTDKLKEIAEDEAFKQQLESQFNGYRNIHYAAKQMLNENGYDEKGINAFEKIRTYLMLNMQTLTNKSTPHIAEMLTIGSNMGVIDAIQNLREYDGVEADITGLMERLLKFEEDNIQNLKTFL